MRLYTQRDDGFYPGDRIATVDERTVRTGTIHMRENNGEVGMWFDFGLPTTSSTKRAAELQAERWVARWG